MKLLKSKKGFTLIELLVVIGILAVLAAIAIPSVAGLIDRANVSADATNANEMTNAIERFTSEYELYCQDIASGALVDANDDGTPDNMDAAQGRVFNVTKVKDRAGIEGIEKPQTATAAGTTGIAIYRDTKYPVNAETMQAIVKNYTKTSSATFEPKQSDKEYYYSPDCGVVVVAPKGLTASADLNKYVQSGMDAKGNPLDDDTVWVSLTATAALGAGGTGTETNRSFAYLKCTTVNIDPPEYTYELVDSIPAVANYGDICVMDGYVYQMAPEHAVLDGLAPFGWDVNVFTSSEKSRYESIAGMEIPVDAVSNSQTSYGQLKSSIGGQKLLLMTGTFNGCANLTEAPVLPIEIPELRAPFRDCPNLTTVRYAGTLAQLGYNGYAICENSYITEIVCSDGTWILD